VDDRARTVIRVRVGVVGPGYIGARHLETWRHLNVTLHAYTRSPARRAEVAAAFPEVTWHPDVEALLGAVDTIDVCTPTDSHAALVLQAAAAGRHVVVEKPMARTLAEAEAMLAGCADAGVDLHVGHLVRYVDAYAAARDTVRAGEVGDLTRLRLYRGTAAPAWGDWFAEPTRSGGVLLDLGIHDIDIARWVAGEVVAVDATMPRPGTGRAVLTHESGAVSEVTAEWGPAGMPFRTEFEIVGTSGRLAHDSTVDRPGGTDPLTAMLGEFKEAIRGGPAPRVTARDAFAALRVALAAAEVSA
jgi:myo-inositol 2-dehydrogenase/D-chiro-inositol 1-dehydrogenase